MSRFPSPPCLRSVIVLFLLTVFNFAGDDLLARTIPLTDISSGAPAATSDIRLAPRKLPAKPSIVPVSPSADIRYVVVKFMDETETRLRGVGLTSRAGKSVTAASRVLEPYMAGEIDRLFRSVDETSLDRNRASLQQRTRTSLADLNGYYRVVVGSPSEAEELVRSLNQLAEVEIAYVEPMPEPAGSFEQMTADYRSFQDYREIAPGGVDADYANLQPGGDGTGVKIIDIEGGWRDTHEDLPSALGGLIAGTMINDPSWQNHGTAVLGEMVGADNGFGVLGISHASEVGMISIGSLSFAEAMYIAVDTLEPGDVVLIELHAPGPRYNFQGRPDQLGYVCMEYWQANFDAIQYAWAKGVIVVEAAGNGAEDFDDVIYGQLFDTTYRNSHAIVVGAGYPAASPLNLQRQSFSNYGERVNLQGYGSGVYTTGYGNLAGANEDEYYTSSFSGTSSASPIVTGSVAALQGFYKATYSGAVLGADQVRTLLNATGTPQMGNTAQHIGPRPNLQAAFVAAPAPASLAATPIILETTINVGTTDALTLWLVNHSLTTTMEFSINDNDSLARRVSENWLTATPGAGIVPANDSVAITVGFDATVVGDRVKSYSGVLEISWGHSGNPLDSLLLVPAYMAVPCADSSYTALSTNDLGGPVYNWISAKDLGYKVFNSTFYSLGLDPKDDGTTGPWPIRFPFPFYGAMVDSVYIGVNGGLSFTDTLVDPTGYYSALSLPGSPLASFLSAFWNDLIFNDVAVPDAGIYIYWNAARDTTVIEWYRPSNFNNAADTLTNFEIILTKDGHIVYQYKEVGSSGLNVTSLAGLSEVDCRAHSYYDNGDLPAHQPADSFAVRFTNTLGIYVQSGNVNNVGGVTVADLTYLVSYLFNGGPAPVVPQSADVNCSGGTTVADLTYLVGRLFNGGPAPCGFFQFF